MFRIDPDALSCDSQTFAEALAAEGVPCRAGYIQVPLYKYPVFQDHNFFAGHWPVKEMGLTEMDYSKVCCPQTEEILRTCIQIPVDENASEEWLSSVAMAIQKVAAYYMASR
jgi:dTDP-4-amino-4,6-dideoxygalactose transaminase